MTKPEDFQGIYSRWECEEVGGLWVESHVSRNGRYTREYCRSPTRISRWECEKMGGLWVVSVSRNGRYTGYCRPPTRLRKDR